MTAQDRPHLRKAPDANTHPTAAPLHQDTILYGTTADSGAKDRIVTLEVDMPKSLRSALRAEAKGRGTTVDEIVIQALRTRR